MVKSSQVKSLTSHTLTRRDGQVKPSQVAHLPHVDEVEGDEGHAEDEDGEQQAGREQQLQRQHRRDEQPVGQGVHAYLR
jgi:hypothetical protein